MDRVSFNNSNDNNTTTTVRSNAVNPWNSWDTTDTPESPPIFEKESYSEPIEYHDTVLNHGGGDVDHRLLRHLVSAGKSGVVVVFV